MTNLVSLERALFNLPAASSTDERTLAALIAAASTAIRRWCRRNFTLESRDEVLDGTTAPRLLLREYPVQAVESVRGWPQVVLEVSNTQTTTNQQARVAVTAGGLELVRVASGVLSRDTSVTWSDHPTLQAVAAAVNALGAGWSAREAAGFASWPAQDLFVRPALGDGVQAQGAVNCRGRWTGLVLHTVELAGYCWDARGWLYRHDPWVDQPWVVPGPWKGGPGAWRVQYTAGYAEVPAAVAEACAEWVAVLFAQTRRDPALAAQAIPGSLAQTWVAPAAGRPPARVASLLAPYRRYEV